MRKATVVQVYSAADLDRRSGQAVLVKLDEPISYGNNNQTNYLYVSAATIAPFVEVYDYPTDEVYLFPADENGEVLDWLELHGSQRGTLSIRETMTEAGYDVSSWPEDIA